MSIVQQTIFSCRGISHSCPKGPLRYGGGYSNQSARRTQDLPRADETINKTLDASDLDGDEALEIQHDDLFEGAFGDTESQYEEQQDLFEGAFGDTESISQYDEQELVSAPKKCDTTFYLNVRRFDCIDKCRISTTAMQTTKDLYVIPSNISCMCIT